MNLESEKIALSLSGGGSKGAYTVGVLKYLVEEKKAKNFKIIYGTSTGALIAPLITLYSINHNNKYLKRLEKIYTSVHTHDILGKNFPLFQAIAGEEGALMGALIFGGKSIYNVEPLKKLIEENISDLEWEIIIDSGKSSNNPIEMGFCSFNFQKGTSEIITNVKYPQIATLKKGLIASVCQPALMPDTKIFEESSEQYYDGGLKDYNPIGFIYESEFFKELNRIVTISNDPREINKTKKVYESIDQVLFRAIEVLAMGVFDADLRTAELWNLILTMKKYVNDENYDEIIENLPLKTKTYAEKFLKNNSFKEILNIYPHLDIPIEALKFNPEKMKEVLKIGYEDAKAQIK